MKKNLRISLKFLSWVTATSSIREKKRWAACRTTDGGQFSLRLVSLRSLDPFRERCQINTGNTVKALRTRRRTGELGAWLLVEAIRMDEIAQSSKSKIRRKWDRIKAGRTPGFKVKRNSKGKNRNKCRQVTRKEWTYFQERKCKINIIKSCKD